MYIYIYMYMYMKIYIYTYIYIHIHIFWFWMSSSIGERRTGTTGAPNELRLSKCKIYFAFRVQGLGFRVRGLKSFNTTRVCSHESNTGTGPEIQYSL